MQCFTVELIKMILGLQTLQDLGNTEIELIYFCETIHRSSIAHWGCFLGQAQYLGNCHQYLKRCNNIGMSALVQTEALSRSHFCLPGDYGQTPREKEEQNKFTMDSFKTLPPSTYPEPDMVCLNSNSKGLLFQELG